ncbi:hypothetical protein NWT09_11875 [Mycolicibacterium sp. jd]|uniref:hypothetical protein n=1 Tax=unclassified Mycolicibacterium TaxID=2636767 RepID=UPI00351B40E0
MSGKLSSGPPAGDEELARKLVQTAVWMKRQYQDSGLVVARVFCEAKGIDLDAVELEVREATQVR